MSAGTADAPESSAANFPDSRGLFARKVALALDLGCGNGVFLAALAAREPGMNVLGVERKSYRVRQARRRTDGLPNARVAEGDAREVLRGLPQASVARAYLLFSDPWPKRRHAVRRLVQAEFAGLLRARLEPGGAFFFASDSADYASRAREIFRAAGWGVGDWVVAEDWPRTEFERRFLAEGLEVSRFRAWLP